MGLQKNVASQKWRVFAFDTTTGVAKTGDAANITAKIAKDWAAAGATNDVNPTETEDGYYLFDLTQAETNADNLDLYPESATANIQVIGVPGSMLTSPVGFPDDVMRGTDSAFLAASAPTNFGDLAITVTTGLVSVGTNNDKTGYSISGTKTTLDALNDFNPTTNTVANVTLVATTTTNTDMRGTDSALLAASAPTNFGDLSITASTGLVSLAATGLDAIASTADGMVEIAKAIWDRVLTGATHNIATSAGRRLRQLQESGAVYNGRVWVDTVNGVAGTTPYENGTSDNHVNLWSSALTIAPNVNGGLIDFHIINGSDITLSANSDAYSIFGNNYILQLGGQSCADIYVEGADVSGIGTAASGHMHFEGCDIGTASMQAAHCDFCTFTATVTHTLAGNQNYHNCYSGVAGIGGPTFTKTAGQVVTTQFRDWKGSITCSGIEASDVITISGTELGDVVLNGADGTAKILGIYESLADNRTGSPTLVLGGYPGSDVPDILDDTGTSGVIIAPTGLDLIVSTATGMVEIAKAVWDRIISKANHNIGQSAGKILRLSGDLVQVDGAVSDASPAIGGFDTTLTDVDTYWEDAVLIFSNGSANAGLGKPVSTFLNTNGAMTFAAPDDWPVTPVNGDDFTIYATHVHPVAQIADAVLAAGDIDGFSLEEAQKVVLAALAGVVAGAGTTTVTISAASDDSKTRITATVDANGNRSATTLDVTG